MAAGCRVTGVDVAVLRDIGRRITRVPDGFRVHRTAQRFLENRAKAIDIDVTGVNRLRLILSDGGDGNKLDAGDWCEPVLKR